VIDKITKICYTKIAIAITGFSIRYFNISVLMCPEKGAERCSNDD
jgi:hypothetical protein